MSAAKPPDRAKSDLSVPPANAFPIVGVGASAGGFEAFNQLLQHLPKNPGLAIVLIQHLDPTHASSLVDLLAKTCAMPVQQVTDGTPVAIDHVYVIPPNTDMIIREGILRLTPRIEPPGMHLPIDLFLQTLAKDCSGRAIGVILSGTASDGTLGLKAIKTEGGITFAQDETARFDGMPRNAIAAGLVDFVLPPAAIAVELLKSAKHPYVNHGVPAAAPEQVENTLNSLFRVLRELTGVDFAAYKRATLQRRIQRRMVMNQIAQLGDYVRFVTDHPAEAQALSEDILIHVTSFFREPETFDVVRNTVWPALMKDRPGEKPIRIWVPGCSTGEEAYSLAISLLEFLGDKTGRTVIKIFGTDISEQAVEKARVGRYPANIATEVSPERLRSFFVQVNGDYQIKKNVRDLCVFARHDVAHDPPFSHMDLISCRNVLIYLGPELQQRVLPTLHYALDASGLLLLGRSETVGIFTNLFAVVDGKHKIYSRKAAAASYLTFGVAASGSPTSDYPLPSIGGVHPLGGLNIQKEADRFVLARYAPAGVVINEDLEILQFRGRTGAFLAPAPGAATWNLLKMAREGLLLPLRTAIEEAKKSGTPVRMESISVKTNDHNTTIDVVVSTLPLANTKQRFFLVLFEEKHSPEKHEKLIEPPLPTETEPALDSLRQELAETRLYLQSVIEASEASNEELKAANEEIVSSSEELRSTNEELQTTQEELQAANEELGTLNEELQHRNRVATELSNDLANLLGGVQIPIVLLGRDLRIRHFTPTAANLLNLIPTDIGRPFSDIKSRIQLLELDRLIAEVLQSLITTEREVQDVEGRWYHLAIRPYRTLDDKIDGVVITVVDVDLLKRSQLRIIEAESHLRAILDNAAEGIITIDDRGVIQSFNKAAEKMFGYNVEEVRGNNVAMLMPSPYREEHDGYLDHYRKTGDGKIIGIGREVTGRRKDGTIFPLHLGVSEVQGDRRIFAGIVRDITDLKQAQDRALQSERLAAIGQLSAGLAHESRNALQRSQACLEMLAREVEPQPRAMDLIKRLQAAQNHLLQLYEEVRSYAAPLKLKRSRCDLGKVLHDVWDNLGTDRDGKTVQLHSSPGELDLNCEVDPSQIDQVFRNILENSLDVVPDPGEIEAHWTATDLNGRPALRVALRDNGPGLNAEERERLFEAFYTTKTHGTGLGMTIARRIAEAHQGRIEIGAPTQGTEIIVTLPRGK